MLAGGDSRSGGLTSEALQACPGQWTPCGGAGSCRVRLRGHPSCPEPPSATPKCVAPPVSCRSACPMNAPGDCHFTEEALYGKCTIKPLRAVVIHVQCPTSNA